MDIEKRSIEFIPENERYGTAKRLFTIWFSANMQVTTLVVGTLGIVAGLSLFWTVIGIIVGNMIGTIFMAGHSAQGPHLGIPQMIQSRAQFGVLGASFPLFIVVLSYVLFTAANAVIMRDSIKAIMPMSDNASIIFFGALTLIISFIGYELIHKMAAFMSALSGIVFIIAAVIILKSPSHELTWVASTEHGFKGSAFMLVIAQAASWTLGFGPYVADYSRYLPKNISTRSTFWYSYIGNVLGATLVMLLGALLASAFSNSTQNPGTAIARLFGPYATEAYIVIVLGVLEINVLNLYSAYMSSTTIFTGYKGMNRISSLAKFSIMFAVAIIATLIAVATQYNFDAYFSDILNAQIYVLVPWSSINLVDFYLVRKGKYSIKCMYDVDGSYGKYNVTTLLIFLLTIIVELPFMDLSFYHGIIARAVGADISWIPALIVPGALYFAFTKERVKLLAHINII